MCERKLSHKCIYKSENKVIIVAHDYSDFSPLSSLTSSLNDVSLIWKYFRRYRCVNKEQIFIYGNMNISGKMLGWNSRFNLKDSKQGSLDESEDKSEDSVIKKSPKISKKTYFYYSGHGYPDGSFDIPPIFNFKYIDYCILDCCYSYLWDHSKTLIASTTKHNVLSSSTHKISKFTLDFVKHLMYNEKSMIKFREWIEENNYTLICESGDSAEAKFKEDIL